MRIPNHDVRFAFGSAGEFVETEDITSYDIVCDMLTLADSFSLQTRITQENWALAPRDAQVHVWIDDSKVLSGRIDSRRKSDTEIIITGRDKGGRLVDTSAPLTTFGGKRILELGDLIVGDLFKNVRLDNLKNRRLVAGRRARATRGSEPIQKQRNARHKVTPGETRGQVLLELLDQAEKMAWSSADGEDFIIGEPNQNQTPSYTFFQAAENSARAAESNCTINYVEDCGEQYSEITVCGSGSASKNSYSRKVTQLRSTTVNEFEFGLEKKLLIQDGDIRTEDEAKRRAIREMAERNAAAIQLEVTVEGHGQYHENGALTLYHFDRVAQVEDEQIGLSGAFFITRVHYKGRADSDETIITAVPVGTELRARG